VLKLVAVLALVAVCAGQALVPVTEPSAGGDGSTILGNNGAVPSDGKSTILTTAASAQTGPDPNKLTVDPQMYAPTVIAGQENRCACMAEVVCPCRTGYYPPSSVAVVATAVSTIEESAKLTPVMPPSTDMLPIKDLQQGAFTGSSVRDCAGDCPGAAAGTQVVTNVVTDGAALPTNVDTSRLTVDPSLHPTVIIAGSAPSCGCLAQPVCGCRASMLEVSADPGTTVLQPAPQSIQPDQKGTVMTTAPADAQASPCTTCGETQTTWDPATKSVLSQFPVQPSYSLAEASSEQFCGCVTLAVCPCRQQWTAPEVLQPASCGCSLCPCPQPTCGCNLCPCQQFVKPLEPEFVSPEIKTVSCPCVGLPTCGC